MTSGGVEVAYSSSCDYVDYVIETSSAADEDVLLGVGPFSSSVRYGVIDCGSDGLVVGAF